MSRDLDITLALIVVIILAAVVLYKHESQPIHPLLIDAAINVGPRQPLGPTMVCTPIAPAFERENPVEDV